MNYLEAVRAANERSVGRQRTNNTLIAKSLELDAITPTGNIPNIGGGGAPKVVSGGGGGAGVSINGDWGDPGKPKSTQEAAWVKANLVSFKTPWGGTATVHRNARKNFEGLFNDLYAAGWKPKENSNIYAFSNRNIAGTNKPSNHRYGRAVDLDPKDNRGDRLGGGGSTYGNLPRNVAEIAKKNGLVWGGTWKNRDPMHFEVAGYS